MDRFITDSGNFHRESVAVRDHRARPVQVCSGKAAELDDIEVSNKRALDQRVLGSGAPAEAYAAAEAASPANKASW
jgi:hypothetical protein